MKMKEIGPKEGERESLAPPVDLLLDVDLKKWNWTQFIICIDTES